MLALVRQRAEAAMHPKLEVGGQVRGRAKAVGGQGREGKRGGPGGPGVKMKRQSKKHMRSQGGAKGTCADKAKSRLCLPFSGASLLAWETLQSVVSGAQETKGNRAERSQRWQGVLSKGVGGCICLRVCLAAGHSCRAATCHDLWSLS